MNMHSQASCVADPKSLFRRCSRRPYLELFFVALLTLCSTLRAAPEMAPGAAKGSLTYENKTLELKFAAAFIDQKKDDKPTILLLTDRKLPTEKWTSSADISADNSDWGGVVFFLKEGQVYRCDVRVDNMRTSVAGVFDLKLNAPAGKDLAGAAEAAASSKDAKLSVAFHALAK